MTPAQRFHLDKRSFVPAFVGVWAAAFGIAPSPQYKLSSRRTAAAGDVGVVDDPRSRAMAVRSFSLRRCCCLRCPFRSGTQGFTLRRRLRCSDWRQGASDQPNGAAGAEACRCCSCSFWQCSRPAWRSRLCIRDGLSRWEAWRGCFCLRSAFTCFCTRWPARVTRTFRSAGVCTLRFRGRTGGSGFRVRGFLFPMAGAGGLWRTVCVARAQRMRRAQGVFYEASTLGNFCAFFLTMILVGCFPRD